MTATIHTVARTPGGNRGGGGGGLDTRSGARIPPHNLQAEESLLGAMLLSRDAIVSAVEVRLGPDDFYKPSHGHIFDAITSLYAQGEPADPVTVADELARAGLLEAVGGPAVLISLQAGTPAIGNAGRYARIVEEHALLRSLLAVAGNIAEIAYGLPEDVIAAVDEAEALVFEVAEKHVTDSTSALRDLLADQLDYLEGLYERNETITGLATGFIDLDQQLAGLQPSNLVIVGGRPGSGKTSLALNIAAHAGMKVGVPVLVFSLEMSHRELTQRLLCSEAHVDSNRMRTGRLVDADWPKVTNAIGRLAEANIFIDDNPHLTVMEIRAKARRMKSRHGLGLIVVDYLQLMTGRSSAENRQVEVSEISRGLKILARELEVPVVALSQLSRNLESRADKRPVLADLRESGCMVASTGLLRADTGEEVTLGELMRTGERNVPVWSVDDDMQLVPATLTHAFSSGVKRVYELRLASGRSVVATANHRFLTMGGWLRLDELVVGTALAVREKAAEPAMAGGSNRSSAGSGAGSVGWDAVVAVERRGTEPVYDATVLGTHNFVAHGIVSHNSLEQDADVVIFIYRDEAYNRDSPDRGTAEIIVAKHRNGPTGTTRLAFLDHITKFANMARSI
jgi:replicative DNA helicase